MKRKDMQALLLLAQSGELSRAQRAKLDDELAKDEFCRSDREVLDRMLGAVRKTPLDRDVSPFVLRRIDQEARARLERPLRGRRGWGEASVIQMWRPAIVSAAAAVVLLFLGVSFFRGQQAPEQTVREAPAAAEETLLAWDQDLDTEIDDLFDVLAMAGDGLDDGAETEGIDDLVNELIDLEGLQI